MPAETKSPHWIVERQREVRALHAYVEDLEKQNAFLIGEMSCISQGIVFVSAPEGWTWHAKLQQRAAKAVQRCLDQYKIRPKPKCWW